MTRLLRIKMAVAGVLGEECRVCGAPGHWPGLYLLMGRGPEPLQVGHPSGRRWSIRRLNTLQRWTKYLREALAGKVQAECGPCNRKHGGALRYKKVDRTRQGAKRAERQIAGLSVEGAEYLLEHGTEAQQHQAARVVLDLARPLRQTAHTCWCGDIDCRDHT